MSQPRLSGAFHNCALHAGIPEILKQVKSLATMDRDDKGPPLLPAYQRLKDKFAEYYGLDTLTWQNFYKLLTEKIQNNQKAAQIILGLVLRELMCDNGAPDSLRQVQADGRFPMVSIDEAQTVYAPLGIKLVQFQRPSDDLLRSVKVNSEGYYEVPHGVESDVKHQIAKVDVYHEGKSQHWERLPRSKIGSATNDAKSFAAAFPEVHAAVEKMQSDTRKDTTLKSLRFIKSAVKARAESSPSKRKVVATDHKINLSKIIEDNVEYAAAKYKKHLSDKKIDVKPDDLKAKSENMRSLISDLFKAEKKSSFDPKPVELKPNPGEDDKAFKKRQQIAKDKELAKKLQKEEIRKFRP